MLAWAEEKEGQVGRCARPVLPCPALRKQWLGGIRPKGGGRWPRDCLMGVERAMWCKGSRTSCPGQSREACRGGSTQVRPGQHLLLECSVRRRAESVVLLPLPLLAAHAPAPGARGRHPAPAAPPVHWAAPAWPPRHWQRGAAAPQQNAPLGRPRQERWPGHPCWRTCGQQAFASAGCAWLPLQGAGWPPRQGPPARPWPAAAPAAAPATAVAPLPPLGQGRGQWAALLLLRRRRRQRQ